MLLETKTNFTNKDKKNVTYLPLLKIEKIKYSNVELINKINKSDYIVVTSKNCFKYLKKNIIQILQYKKLLIVGKSTLSGNENLIKNAIFFNCVADLILYCKQNDFVDKLLYLRGKFTTTNLSKKLNKKSFLEIKIYTSIFLKKINKKILNNFRELKIDKANLYSNRAIKCFFSLIKRYNLFNCFLDCDFYFLSLNGVEFFNECCKKYNLKTKSQKVV